MNHPRTTSAGLALALLGFVLPGLAATTYTTDAGQSSLGFTATQTGAKFDGKFDEFQAGIVFADDDLAHSRFDVKVTVKSVNTGDDDRDTTLRGDDLFAVEKFPTAHFVTTGFTRQGSGKYQATGKLTIRDVTRQIHLPFTFKSTPEAGKPVAWLKGGVTLNRLDYGVGQGEWKDTAWVANEVEVKFALRLLPGAAPTAKIPAPPPQGKSQVAFRSAPGAQLNRAGRSCE